MARVVTTLVMVTVVAFMAWLMATVVLATFVLVDVAVWIFIALVRRMGIVAPKTAFKARIHMFLKCIIEYIREPNLSEVELCSSGAGKQR